eukprot:symbB.v1.2.014843.t1/scaffold1079.1/size239879/1
MITENLSNFEEDFRHVVCGLASVDLGELLPSWISWMNPWLEPTAPDLCGAVSQSGHLQSTASAAWSSASFGSAASPRIETGQEEGADLDLQNHSAKLMRVCGEYSKFKRTTCAFFATHLAGLVPNTGQSHKPTARGGCYSLRGHSRAASWSQVEHF